MERIAALLTVHNRKNKTLACLKCLYDQKDISGYTFDVYLTVDGCTDGTEETVSQLYPDIKVVQGDGKLFWNRGMYRAWERASAEAEYDFYFWLNDDTYLKRNAIEILVDTSRLYQHKAIVVGSTNGTRDSERITYGGMDDSFRIIQPSNVPLVCNCFNGNIVLIPSNVYKYLGKNDPYYSHAIGDFDYGLRASKMHIKSIIAPGVLGVCDEHSALPVWCDPKKALKIRKRAFRSPLGQNPEEYFVFDRRHNGLLLACFHYLTIHVRLYFPWIWTVRKKRRC